MKTEREANFDKIKVKVLIGDKQDATFSIKGGTYKFSSKGLTDREHDLLSKAYRAFVENKDIKLPPSIKFNMIENCIHEFNDLSELVRGFTLDAISVAGEYFPAHVADDIIKKVHEKRRRETVRETMDRLKQERAPAQSKAAAKYVYPEGMSHEDKRRLRAKARAEARKRVAD